MPELRRLRYFLAVASARNFTRAAAQLGVAQPALSRQVRQLEEELGVELLERTTHSFELTAAGAFLLARGGDLLAAADELWRATRAFGTGERGAVVLGYGASAGYETVPLLLRALAARPPGVEVTTRLLTIGEILDGLRARHARRRRRALPAARAPTRCARSCVGAAGRPPAPRRRPRAAPRAFALEALGETALLLHPREANPGHYDAVLDLFRERGVEPRVRHRSVALDLAQTPVVAGEAMAIVGESSRSGAPRRARLAAARRPPRSTRAASRARGWPAARGARRRGWPRPTSVADALGVAQPAMPARAEPCRARLSHRRRARRSVPGMATTPSIRHAHRRRALRLRRRERATRRPCGTLRRDGDVAPPRRPPVLRPSTRDGTPSSTTSSRARSPLYEPGSIGLEITGLVIEGDQAVLEWTTRARTPRRAPLREPCIGVFTVRDGAIHAVREYMDTLYAQRLLFG